MSAARSNSRRARFTQAASSRARPAEGEPPRPERGAKALRSKPVPTTVALDPVDHHYLVQATTHLADEIGVVALPRNRVWAALLAEMRENPELYQRVRDRLAEMQD